MDPSTVKAEASEAVVTKTAHQGIQKMHAAGEMSTDAHSTWHLLCCNKAQVRVEMNQQDLSILGNCLRGQHYLLLGVHDPAQCHQVAKIRRRDPEYEGLLCLTIAGAPVVSSGL